MQHDFHEPLPLEKISGAIENLIEHCSAIAGAPSLESGSPSPPELYTKMASSPSSALLTFRGNGRHPSMAIYC
jgi:hypothetical protein